jgi:hypothetical protein
MSHQIHTYSELRQQIHDDLRIQHPEWVEPNGESSMCLMELLDSLTQRGISEGELLGLSVRIHVGLLFEPSAESACPLKRQVEIIDAEEQQEAVAGCPVIGAHQ